MAQKLLQAKGDTTKLGRNWGLAFMSHHPGLKSRYSRTLDQDRYLAEDPRIIQDWFVLYASVKEKYGILDKDTYNMDKKRFMMGVAGSAKVVISKYEKQAFVKQCGNREWASLIEGIGLRRQLPMWCIFRGKKYLDKWYSALKLRQGHYISLSDNGWTNNELGLDWLKTVFKPNTASCLQGTHRLLVIDGHNSHISTEFIKYAQAKKIECLCLPPHTTHLLQPLDVGVFGPLAHSYKKQLEGITRFSTYNIDKVNFLTMVQKARKEGISSHNIESAWKATGLIPYSKTGKKQVLSSVSTLSECLPLDTIVPQTPRNIDQVRRINDLIVQFCNQTLDTPKLALFSKLIKGAKHAMADCIILNTTNAELYEASVQKKNELTAGEVNSTTDKEPNNLI